MVEKMDIQWRDIETVKPYERNAKKHPDDQVQHIANSLKRFGWKQPLVVDKDGVVVVGHGRLLAAKKLGLKTVPCVCADDLTEDEIKAYRLADNRLSESAWDKTLLEFELDALPEIDMSDFGFDVDAFKKQELEAPEVEFTEVLGEEHNYVVLYFDNEVDWLQMTSILDIEPKMNLATRKDGKVKDNMKRISIGRVLNGAEALERMREHFENIN